MRRENYSAKLRALIVDDEPLARSNVAVLLRVDPDIGTVSECGSGTEAIGEIRVAKPDLLFLDVQMPECDGFDVLDEPGIGTAPLRYTSMESRRQRPTAMPKVREALIRNLEQVFGLERHHLYTRHPLIRRKVFSHVYAPSPG